MCFQKVLAIVAIFTIWGCAGNSGAKLCSSFLDSFDEKTGASRVPLVNGPAAFPEARVLDYLALQGREVGFPTDFFHDAEVTWYEVRDEVFQACVFTGKRGACIDALVEYPARGSVDSPTSLRFFGCGF